MTQRIGGSRVESPQTWNYGVAPSGWRLPAETRLGAADLQVSDLDRSLAYYEEVLGLRRLDGAAGPVALAPAGSAAPLVRLHEHPGATPVPASGRLGLYHFAILLPDRASLGRFVTHASSIGLRFGSSDHLVSEALYLRDPDGLGIEIYADRPRSAWRQAGDQLEMTTLPLDLGSLVRAAGGEAWSGMPPETRLGHVHLHVDDLGQAASFYHEGLGFDKIVWSYPGALFLSAGGYHHHLGLNTWASGAPRAGEGDARLLEWEIVLPTGQDVEAATKSLLERGFSPVTSSAEQGVFDDPVGTRVRIGRG